MARLLSPDILEALRQLGTCLAAGEPVGDGAADLASRLGRLGPEQLPRAEPEIYEAAGLWRTYESTYSPAPRRLSALGELDKTDALKYLFLFHRDGRIREAALQKLAGPLPSAFWFAALAWRLNDWVRPVRAAAIAAAHRCFPATTPEVAAGAAATILVRMKDWSRWSTERAVVTTHFARSDVLSRLADLIAERVTGAMPTLLWHALRHPEMDAHLERLALSARQPGVRASVLATLARGTIEWRVGTQWRWVNKALGKGGLEAVMASRELTVQVDLPTLIRAGLADRSGIVRKAALSALIRHRLDFPDAADIALRMRADRSPGVRERAAFLLRQEGAPD